jgi:hypothetical protein
MKVESSSIPSAWQWSSKPKSSMSFDEAGAVHPRPEKALSLLEA